MIITNDGLLVGYDLTINIGNADQLCGVTSFSLNFDGDLWTVKLEGVASRGRLPGHHQSIQDLQDALSTQRLLASGPCQIDLPDFPVTISARDCCTYIFGAATNMQYQENWFPAEATTWTLTFNSRVMKIV